MKNPALLFLLSLFFLAFPGIPSLHSQQTFFMDDPADMQINPIGLPANIKAVFDTVFPGVRFRYQRDMRIMGDGMGALQEVFNDSVYRINGTLNRFLFEIETITGRKRSYPDEMLAKALVYLTYLQEEGGGRNSMAVASMKVTSVDTLVMDEFKRPYYYRDPRYNDKFPRMNYKVQVVFQSAYDYPRSGGWKNDIWYMCIAGHEVIAFANQRTTNNGVVMPLRVGYQQTVQCMSSYDYKNYLEELNRIKHKYESSVIK